MPTIRSSILAAAACIATLAAAAPQARAQDHGKHAPTAVALDADELRKAIDEVRRATSPFQSLDTAMARGYTDQYPAGCAASPDGAQGFHYLNPGLVDGAIDVLQPELVMYEPQADGSMELVGVDYIIPFDQWTGDEPPTLLGQPLGRMEALGVWAIHIWAWRDNPSGVFAPWNPTVSCRHAR